MKIKFKNYTYFEEGGWNPGGEYDATQDPNSWKQYEYDPDHYERLLANRQYDEAIAYASKYIPNDIERRRELEDELNIIKNEGHKMTELYSRVDNDLDLKKLDFINNLYVDGGLDKLYNNSVVQAYRDQMSLLGSEVDPSFAPDMFDDVSNLTPDAITNKAKKLSITFEPEKWSFLGVDKLARDNRFNIDNFYKDSGLSEARLKAMGVTVIHKDGRTTLEFDKNHPLAPTILYNLPETINVGNGNEQSIMPNTYPTVRSYDDKGHELDGSNTVRKGIIQIKQMIDDANKVKDNLIGASEKEFEYTSIISEYSDDAIRALQEAYHASNGAMSTAEFNRQYKLLGGDKILDEIDQMGTADIRMYSNAYNKSWTDEIIVPMDQKQKSALVQLIGANRPNIRKAAMEMNGELGTLITIVGEVKQANKLGLGYKPEEALENNRIQIFLPGIGQEQAQKAIQRNTTTRAAKELNDMENWQYSYKLEDGSKLIYAGKNDVGESEFIHQTSSVREPNPTLLSKAEAHRLLNKSMIVEDVSRNLKYEFMNKDGVLVDTKGYETAARYAALQAADEMYPGLVIRDFSGRIYDPRNPKDLDAIFGEDINENNVQYEVYKKLQEIYDVYNKIMRGISNYY